MKTKSLSKKMRLKKQTVAALQNVEMSIVRGGDYMSYRGCDRTEPWGCNTADISCWNCIDIIDVSDPC